LVVIASQVLKSSRLYALWKRDAHELGGFSRSIDTPAHGRSAVANGVHYYFVGVMSLFLLLSSQGLRVGTPSPPCFASPTPLYHLPRHLYQTHHQRLLKYSSRHGYVDRHLHLRAHIADNDIQVSPNSSDGSLSATLLSRS